MKPERITVSFNIDGFDFCNGCGECDPKRVPVIIGDRAEVKFVCKHMNACAGAVQRATAQPAPDPIEDDEEPNPKKVEKNGKKD